MNKHYGSHRGRHQKSSLRLFGVSLVLLCFSSVSMACELPESLSGRQLLLRIYGLVSATNPFAESVLEVTFSETTYVLKDLKTGQGYEGQYRYRRFEKDLAQLTGLEKVGKSKMQYTETYVCETNKTGYYIFSVKQEGIGPKVRQNTGRYIFQQ
ncbi:hypothetical protein [uncultured Shewanella sp.]|uniref:hypothetical protein n=1 Tax=uncultured Shewanella sp. TaxID=173975 RepID=UPI002603E37D|nr:hypothetical protein [uncultured Shewanella sp.]